MKHTSRLDIPQHKLVRSLVDYELIGRKWKRSDALSRPILIDRGLELFRLPNRSLSFKPILEFLSAPRNPCFVRFSMDADDPV